MKKIFIIACLTLCFCLSGFAPAAAQGIKTGKFEYGLKAGLGLTKMPDNKTGTTLYYEESADPISGELLYDWISAEDKAAMGFCFGAVGIYHLNGSFALQAEVIFTRKGVEVDHSGSDADTEYKYVLSHTDKIKLNYLEIPVLVKYRIPVGESYAPSVYLGGALGVKLSAKYDADYAYDVYDLEDNYLGRISRVGEPDIDNIKSTDFSLVFGGEVGIDIGSRKLLFDLRYTLGLTELFDDVNVDDIPRGFEEFPDEYPIVNTLDGKAPSMKNSSLTISVGFLF